MNGDGDGERQLDAQVNGDGEAADCQGGGEPRSKVTTQCDAAVLSLCDAAILYVIPWLAARRSTWLVWHDISPVLKSGHSCTVASSVMLFNLC